MQKSPYDRDYFENGLSTGKSCYVNYSWMPELTIKMAYRIVKYLGLDDNTTVLDYGCSKGFLVKALRLLDIEAYGCDISSYAIDHVDADVREYCNLISSPDRLIPFEDMTFDWLITKDVLEHIREDSIRDLLNQAHSYTSQMFHVIPLASSDGQFVINEYHDDPTHITIKEKDWWIDLFRDCGWISTSFSYKVEGIKQNWWEVHEHGNGFFMLQRA